MHHPTDRITHTTAFVTPVVEHWLEREIAQWVHPMRDRSDDPPHHERTVKEGIKTLHIKCITVLSNVGRAEPGLPHLPPTLMVQKSLEYIYLIINPKCLLCTVTCLMGLYFNLTKKN